MDNSRYDKIFWIYLIAVTIIRLLCIGRFELFYDEAFYWLSSRHLDLSYHVNTPLVNYIIRLFTAVGGNSEFFIRFGSTILGFGIMLLVYLTASRIFNRKTGLLSVLIMSFTPVFIPVGFIMVPDIPLIFFWLCTIFLLWKIFSEEKPPAILWYMSGVSSGLGLLAKDFMVLLIPSVLIYMILSKKNRFWLFRREPYLALVITLIIVSPVIIWNFMHDFASVTFHLSDIHREAIVPLIKNNFFYFIVSQAVIITPIIFVLLVLGIKYAVYTGIKKNQEGFLYLACTSAPVFGFFALWGIFTKIKPHWTVCGYLTAFIILAAVTDRLFVSAKSKSRKALLILPFIITFVPVILTLSIVGLTVTGVHLPLPGKVSSYLHDRLDFVPDRWKKTGERINRIYDEMALSNNVFIFGINEYRTISLAAFYTKRPYKTLLLKPFRNAFQFNFWQKPERLTGYDAIFVSKKRYYENFSFNDYFHSIQEEKPLEFYSKRKSKKTLYISRCYNFKGLSKKED